MKKLTALILFLFCTTFSFGQVQSNCSSNSPLMANSYEFDINSLAIKRLYEINHPDTAKILVP